MVKKLPKTMILALKWFGMDHETYQKYKLNDYVEFPTELNMLPYTKEGFNQSNEE